MKRNSTFPFLPIIVIILLLGQKQFLNSQIVLIPIEGEIESGVYSFLKRAVVDAENKKPEKIIFLINTFGGELHTTFQIVDLISGLNIPTVTLVEEKAISAGTLIAMASRKIYMLSNSIMGDVAPITMGAEGPQMLGEKFQSPLRAKFRALAQKNGYPVKLSEAFVSSEKEIIQVTWKDGNKTIMDAVEYEDLSDVDKENIEQKKTLVPKGELLTMSDQESNDFGFSSGTVASVESLAAFLADKEKISSEIIRIEKTSAEKVFSFYLKYSWLLILVGLGGIYLEVKNPGFGFYGIFALIAFGIFFIGQYMVELADYVDLILLMLGIILLGVEVLILPGFGVFGILGIALLLGSFVLMQQNFVIPENVFEWDILSQNLELVLYAFLGSLVILVLSFMVGGRFMMRSPLVFTKKLFESSETESTKESSMISLFSDEKWVEVKGVAITKLSPSGKIEIEGKVYDAVTIDNYLDLGTKVKVTGKDGYLLVVEALEI